MIKFGKGRQNIWMIVSFILAIVLLSIIVYSIVSNYKEARQERENELMQAGAQQGYEYAVSQIIEQSADCELVSLYKENLTLNLIDISCLKK